MMVAILMVVVMMMMMMVIMVITVPKMGPKQGTQFPKILTARPWGPGPTDDNNDGGGDDDGDVRDIDDGGADHADHLMGSKTLSDIWSV